MNSNCYMNANIQTPVKMLQCDESHCQFEPVEFEDEKKTKNKIRIKFYSSFFFAIHKKIYYNVTLTSLPLCVIQSLKAFKK